MSFVFRKTNNGVFLKPRKVETFQWKDPPLTEQEVNMANLLKVLNDPSIDTEPPPVVSNSKPSSKPVVASEFTSAAESIRELYDIDDDDDDDDVASSQIVQVDEQKVKKTQRTIRIMWTITAMIWLLMFSVAAWMVIGVIKQL